MTTAQSNRRISRYLFPKSLRYQLLIRSLLIIAVLLLLIGILQYILMRNFVYHNQAETMRAQIPNLPRDWLIQPMDHSLESLESPEPGQGRDPIKEMPGQGGAGTIAEREIPDSSVFEFPDRNSNRRPLLLLSDSSLAFIDTEGNFTDISGESSNGNTSPQLSADAYQAIMKDAHKMSSDDYTVARDPNGNDQLLVFRALGPSENHFGLIQMGTDVAALRNVLIRQLLIFIGLSGFALISGVFLSLPIIRRTLDPLSRVITAVERTDAGNFSEQLPENQGQEEIDRLSVAFNKMLTRLDHSFQAEVEAKEQMRQFIADASHELRTPLTSISGFLEVLLRGAASNEEQLRSSLISMQGESKRINKLVEDLLLLAKFDRAPQLWLTDTSLSTVLAEMKPQLLILAGDRQVEFRIDEQIAGQFDSDKIKQVILNLFQNAIQHTDPVSGDIELILSIEAEEASLADAGTVGMTEARYAQLSIRDNGAGIDEHHLPHLFDRFYRSESSRTRRSGGAGLGLSISKSIVEAHGGTIQVESAVGQGSTFTIRLPI